MKGKVLILGGDGYLGWPTAMNLSNLGYSVAVVDNYLKRWIFNKLGVIPLIDCPDLQERVNIWKGLTGHEIKVYIGDIGGHDFLINLVKEFQPDTIIHYGEIPSAPYSMLNHNTSWETIQNNLNATLSVMWAIKTIDTDIHLIKLGTMGEYGTPNIDIEEGFIEIEKNGRTDRLPFPKLPGSFYHLSKVQDSDMLYLGVRMWGLRVTDLNQGPVYGIHTDESRIDKENRLIPHFHYDEFWGTVLNRFITQAVVGIPLTVYGKGGQKRGFLNITDTLQCVRLAVQHPANRGEFRVMNQFTEIFSVNELADKVKTVAKSLGLKVAIQNYPNPRKEAEEHHYNAKNTNLMGLGLQPNYLTDNVLIEMLEIAMRNKKNIRQDIILPGRAKWQ
ncbi:NAD-dependent dehydratase [Dissulfurispira thermophila]|uniref:NAD-dependent dehydratase n=2 Tax=root TaxID=1 RepID=A0A7G1H0I4_9BACT|nr:NAD-dependent epimerase/dehydratase family protein [Dissulfurispira thermophila]BCB96068.1 NAD-dependent dehydratase [Dissulfurispira thermophila]